MIITIIGTVQNKRGDLKEKEIDSIDFDAVPRVGEIVLFRKKEHTVIKVMWIIPKPNKYLGADPAAATITLSGII